jgi:hypothetical protein
MSLLLSRNDVLNLNSESLSKFLELGFPEGSQIDYKISLSGSNKNDEHKEFLKDISSFANAQGGLLIIGVKEPKNGLSVHDQIVGVNDGSNIAKDLERVAATSIDPRIPGLLIKTVELSNKKDVIVVYIPPSMSRPHMVCYQKLRSFYVRHSEASVPMTTHEIQDTVLSSATSEGRARFYADIHQTETLEYLIGTKPSFLIQAVPLMTPSEKWEVLEDLITGVIRGNNREALRNYAHFDLRSHVAPIPTIYGVMGKESRENNDWQTDVHRNGYIQAVYMDIQQHPNDKDITALHEGYHYLFKAFGDMCQALWNATQTDLPYLLRCTYFNAENTAFYIDSFKVTKPYGRHQIIWPDQIREVGQPLNDIIKEWTVQLFNAFGLNWKTPL